MIAYHYRKPVRGCGRLLAARYHDQEVLFRYMEFIAWTFPTSLRLFKGYRNSGRR
jgi:hypothetical protein